MTERIEALEASVSAEYANITLLLQQILDLLADDADDYDYYVDDDMDADCEDDSADDEENSAPAAVVVGVNYKRWGRTEHGRSVTEMWERDETKNMDLGGGTKPAIWTFWKTKIQILVMYTQII